MGKRTKKLLIVLGCVSLFAAGSFLQSSRDYSIVKSTIERADKQIRLANYYSLLSQLQLCVVSSSAGVFKYLRTNDPRDAAVVPLLLDSCDAWLDNLGRNAPDEKTSAMLGQARLFFEGFREGAVDIIERQSRLEDLYGNGMNLLSDTAKLIQIKKLEEEQSKAVIEFSRFTGAIFLSLVQATPEDLKDEAVQ